MKRYKFITKTSWACKFCNVNCSSLEDPLLPRQLQAWKPGA
jgi:hypothetical protein